jgi:hypothetical protein
MRRPAAIIIAVVATLLMFAAPASAQEDYDGTGGISTPTPNPFVGARVTIIGHGCDPGSTVTIYLETAQVGSAVADANGEFTTIITAPDTPGPITVIARCGDNSYALSLNVTAAEALSTTETNSLAVTGTESLPLARLGMVLVAVGVLAVIAARRSRRNAPVSVHS